MFDLFAVEAKGFGATLLQSSRLVIRGGQCLDLTDPQHIELAILSIQTAAKQHLRRGEDLLTLVARVMEMIEASTHRPEAGVKTDVGLHALRAIAMAELLQQEARTRFSKLASLGELARDALACLVRGFAMRFGSSLPPEIERVFPRFAQAVRVSVAASAASQQAVCY